MNNACSLHSPDMNKYTFKWKECGSILVLTPFFLTLCIYMCVCVRVCVCVCVYIYIYIFKGFVMSFLG